MSSRKLSRAKELLQSLKKGVKTSLDSQPLRLDTKRDGDAHLIYFLNEVREVPKNISNLAGEVLQNLRNVEEIPDMQLLFEVEINELNIAEGEEITKLLDKMTEEVEMQISHIFKTLGV